LKTICLENLAIRKKADQPHTFFNAQVACNCDGGIQKLKFESGSTDGEVTIDVERSIGERD